MAFFSGFARRAARPMWATSATAFGAAAVFCYVQQPSVVECASTPHFLRSGDKEGSNTVLFQKFTARYGNRRNAQMNYLDVQELLKELNIRNPYLVGRIFAIMDEDGGGTVDIDEMTSFCTKLAKGSFNAKARFVFNACDINNNGVIEEYEIRKMIKNLVLACHDSVPHYTMAKTEEDASLFHDIELHEVAQFIANKMCYEIFKIADKDKDGHVDWKEFSFWIKRGGRTVDSFFELFSVFDALDPHE